ncbi:MAG: hypothetical protein BJ554DRAFT_21 [Olpidium bornovanus]|uniref:PH domain-containing protein n=1 Tax=Olpidium bornovanus TaxID=278681 RepID=A0A8H8DI73_9FUNG|nr:MAG: hypothetical protein BJ554DRAFT_21 [Olpidium bornovanus]
MCFVLRRTRSPRALDVLIRVSVSPSQSPTASSSSSLRYLPKSERSNVFDSQERVVDYHRIDGTRFLNDAAHSGWLYKQRGAIKTWKKLWFSIKGGVLFYQKHRGDRRVVGTVELSGYKIVPDANIYRGKYCWKAKHDRLRTHFFYTDHAEDMKVWVKHMIKATIVLDPAAPVISSYAAKTVPISVAQDMRPRPPNVTGQNAYGLRGSSGADAPPPATSAPLSSRRA